MSTIADSEICLDAASASTLLVHALWLDEYIKILPIPNPTRGLFMLGKDQMEIRRKIHGRRDIFYFLV